jgi:predicted TIM-barrel fold metal-dependent hydrolase
MTCSCGPVAPEAFFASKARRRSALQMPSASTSRGKRLTRGISRNVDVHHHIAPPDYLKAKMASKLGDENEYRDSLYVGWHPGVALESMDQGGTATAITSITDGTFISLHPERVRIAREVNEFAAKMQQDHPGRFGHFATLPMPDINACLKEIEYALDELNLDGVDIRTSYQRQWLGDAAFAPIYEELDRRKAIVYSHPHQPPMVADLLPGVPGSTIEYCTDTSRAIASVVFGGVTTKYPNVRFIFSHGGGTMPFLLDRFRNLAKRKAHAAKFPKGVDAHLKKLYYEVAQAVHPGALDALMRIAPLDHVLFGTDFPHFNAKDTGAKLADYDGFGTKELAAVTRGNALKLFPRFS